MPTAINTLSDDAKILPNLLGEVIQEQEHKDVFKAVEKLRSGYIAQRKNYDEQQNAELLETILLIESFMPLALSFTWPILAKNMKIKRRETRKKQMAVLGVILLWRHLSILKIKANR